MHKYLLIVFLLYAPALYAAEPALMLFWRPDCPPCMHELDMLPAWSKENPTLPIVIMSLVDAETTHAALAKKTLPGNVIIQVSDNISEMTLAAWGDTRYVLPYSVFMAQNGAVCRSHIGLLGSDRIHTWIKQCADTSLLPH